MQSFGPGPMQPGLGLHSVADSMLVGKPAPAGQQLAATEGSVFSQLFGSAVFAAEAVTMEHTVKGSEDLITPASVEATAGGALVRHNVAAAPAAGAPAHHQCLLCGSLGSQGVCGPLRPASCDGQEVAVHHLCAIWSPSVFQREVGAAHVDPHVGPRRRPFTCSHPCSINAAPACRAPLCTSTWSKRPGAPSSAPATRAARRAPPSPAPTPGEVARGAGALAAGPARLRELAAPTSGLHDQRHTINLKPLLPCP